jgi:hypothetical protein
MAPKVPGTLKGELPSTNRPNRWITGIGLIAVGTLALIAQFVEVDLLGLLFLPALGLIFLLWGLLTRNGGLLVPGGILIGLGVGTLLVDTFFTDATDNAQAGIIMLAFTAGWLLITILSAFALPKLMWWPLIPALIMGLIGGALIADALGMLSAIGRIWPIFLILGGIYFIVRRRTT